MLLLTVLCFDAIIVFILATAAAAAALEKCVLCSMLTVDKRAPIFLLLKFKKKYFCFIFLVCAYQFCIIIASIMKIVQTNEKRNEKRVTHSAIKSFHGNAFEIAKLLYRKLVF